MRTLLPFIAVVGVATLSANPLITTSVNCQAYGFQSVTSASSCSQGTPPSQSQSPHPPFASASSTASVVLQENPQDWLTITMQNNASSIDGIAYYNSQGQLLNQISAISNAGANNSIHIDLTTDGPQRPGILQWQWTPIWQGNPGDFYASLNYKIGQYSGSCGGSIGLCSGPGSNAPPIAFALGTPFTFDLD